MNSFDIGIIHYLNQYSQHSWMFDKLMVFVSTNNFLRGGLFATIIWWAWFRRGDRDSHRREYIISTLFGCVIAMALARALALTLPFRLRPMHEEELHFLPPHGMPLHVLDGWSSFPSDHAVFFFTLSVSLLFIVRRVGICALFYSALFIALPRVYLGLHYPTDIIAGAVIGTAIALIANIYLAKHRYMTPIIDLSDSRPGIFYPVFFLFTYQIANMFYDSRFLAGEVFKLIQSVLV